MEEIITKWPNWARYIFAIPLSILAVIFIEIVISISIAYISEPNSLYANIINFIYANGGNVIIFFMALNSVLPKYQFQITLIVSIIFAILSSCGIGYLFAYDKVLNSTIISINFCYGFTNNILCNELSSKL